MSVTRIVVAGAAGRMGRALLRAVADDGECSLVGALEAAGHPDLHADAGELAGLGPRGIPLSHDAGAVLASADALIDFTTPAVSVALAALATKRCVAHVIGTTGFSFEDEARIRFAARDIPIVK